MSEHKRYVKPSERKINSADITKNVIENITKNVVDSTKNIVDSTENIVEKKHHVLRIVAPSIDSTHTSSSGAEVEDLFMKSIRMKMEEKEREFFLQQLHSATDRKDKMDLLSRLVLDWNLFSVIARDLGEVSKLDSMTKRDQWLDLVEKWKIDEQGKKRDGKKYKPLLNKKETIMAQKAVELLEKDENRDSIRLDDWQREFIDMANLGKSVLVVATASLGKTFISMQLLRKFIAEKDRFSKKKLVYICVSSHLALQVFSDMMATFSGIQVGLVTEMISSVPNDCSIYVGTAIELSQYFNGLHKNFDIGIFDEIHTLSIDHGVQNGQDRENMYSLMDLLRRCKEQVIGLSATVSSVTTVKEKEEEEEDWEKEEEEEEIDQVSVLRRQLVTLTGIPEDRFHTIVRHQRFVPLKEWIYDDSELKIVSKEKGSDYIQAIGSSLNFHHNEKTMFFLLKRLQEKDKFPVILFGEDERSTFDEYTSIVDYVKKMDEYEYSVYHSLMDDLQELYEKQKEELVAIGADGDDVMKMYRNVDKKRKNAAKNSQNETLILEHYHGMAEGIIRKAILDCVKRWQSGQNTYEYMREECDLVEKWCEEIAPDFYPGGSIPHELYELCKIMEDTNTRGQLGPCMDQMGRYFRLSNQMGGENVEMLKGIRHPGENEEYWTMRKKMLRIGEGENLAESEVDRMLDVVLFGLQYGIGLILPSLPCVIQFQLLDMMKKKNISVVFASRSMAIGVNYPIRSTVIMATHGTWTTYPVSIMLQMAGRCGRRGKDTEGNVIYWGVSNVRDAHPSALGKLRMEKGEIWLDSKWKEMKWNLYKNRNVEEQDEMFIQVVRDMGQLFGWKKERVESRVEIISKMRRKAWMMEWSRDYSIVQDIMKMMDYLQWMFLRYHTCSCIEFLYLVQFVYVELKKMQYHLLHLSV